MSRLKIHIKIIYIGYVLLNEKYINSQDPQHKFTSKEKESL